MTTLEFVNSDVVPKKAVIQCATDPGAQMDHVSRAECQGFCGWCGADTDDLRWVKDDESENPVPVQTCARCVRSGDEPTEGRNQSS